MADSPIDEVQKLYQQTTQGDWHNEGQMVVDLNTVVVGDESYNWRMVAHCNADSADETDYATPQISEQQAKANADWIALVHNLWPSILGGVISRKERMSNADQIASEIHDLIYANPFDRQSASDAIWRLHNELRFTT